MISSAGVIYYLSDSRKAGTNDATEEKKRASKKERRKAKKEKEREQEPPAVGSTVEPQVEQGMLCFVTSVAILTC